MLLGQLADRVGPARLADRAHHRARRSRSSGRPAGRRPRWSRSRRRARSVELAPPPRARCAEPIMLTRIVVTGLLITVSMPAMAAQCTTCVWPCIASATADRVEHVASTTVQVRVRRPATWPSARRARGCRRRDLVVVDEPAHQRRTDEPGTAGDEDGRLVSSSFARPFARHRLDGTPRVMSLEAGLAHAATSVETQAAPPSEAERSERIRSDRPGRSRRHTARRSGTARAGVGELVVGVQRVVDDGACARSIERVDKREHTRRTRTP